MKKSALLGLSLATALLTACGGGGGSSNPTPMVNNGNTNTSNTNTGNTNSGNQNPKPTTPTIIDTTTANNGTQTNNKTDTTIAGTKLNLSQANNRVSSSQVTTATPNINVVVVNGQQIKFIPENGVNIVSNTINISDANSTRIGGGSRNLQYTRYGYVKQGQDSFLFAQGQKTATMPTTGQAIYTGKAAHIHNGEVKLKDAEFDVNYANKQISGQIRDEGTRNTIAALSAKIDGNTFSGTVGTFSTNGHFYGPNAAEMGGVYKNAIGNISGAFGAKK